MEENWSKGLDFVWQKGFDSPADGFHNTPGDSGGGTKGGVIEATWAASYSKGLVDGTLQNASNADLAFVLKEEFWGPTCDALPAGIDILLFNGRMMSGAYPKLFQRCLGLTGSDVDGIIGKVQSIPLANQCHPETLARALHGNHMAYLENLPSWEQFGGGWYKRLMGAINLALSLIHPPTS